MENQLFKRSRSFGGRLRRAPRVRKSSLQDILERKRLAGVKVERRKNLSIAQDYQIHLHSRKDSLYVDTRKKCNSAFRNSENTKTRVPRNIARQCAIPNTRFIKKFQNINCIAREVLKTSAK